MASRERLLLEFVIRVTYTIPGLDSRLKIFIHQLTEYYFSNTASPALIQHLENKWGSVPFRSANEIAAQVSMLPNQDRMLVAAILQIVQDEADKLENPATSRHITKLTTMILAGVSEDKTYDQTQELKSNLYKDFLRYQARPEVQIRTSLWPLSLDFLLRCLLLFGFSYSNANKAALIGLNATVIPLIIFSTVYLAGRRARKHNMDLLNQYGGANAYRIRYKVSTSQYSWLAFYISTSVFISYLLPNQIHIATLLALIIYYFIYLRFFRFGYLDERELRRQIEKRHHGVLTLNADQNDEAIVDLETKLTSATSRLEAYVLESALFGALSFSGFLQIMAADLISFQDLENFASYIFAAAQAFIHLEGSDFSQALGNLSNKLSLFCLVSVESLVCSIFFLGVIASRLRFSNIADRVRTALNLAKAYNVKEEALNEEHAPSTYKARRLEELTQKVNLQISEAATTINEIAPIMQYMQYFRNAGILVFLIILISSSLFITSALAWTFIILALATSIYFNRTHLSVVFRAVTLGFRIQFMRKSWWFFALALVPQVLAYALRIGFHVRQTDGLMALSHLLVGLFLSTWLLLGAHVDNQYGEIEAHREQLRISRWSFIKSLLAGLVLLLHVGMSFKELSLYGADTMVMISLCSIGPLMYGVGYFLSKKRWLGIICGAMLGTGSIGILFKILHLAGADEMIIVAACSFAIWIPVIIWKRNLFHSLLIRFCLLGALVCFYYFPFFRAPLYAQLAYQHETLYVHNLLKVMHDNEPECLLNNVDSRDAGLSAATDYLNAYGKRFGFTNVYRSLLLHYLDAIAGHSNSLDSARAAHLLPVARQSQQIAFQFSFDELPGFTDLTLEARVLLAMNRKEEAEASLKRVLDRNPPAEVRLKAEAMLAAIRGTVD